MPKYLLDTSSVRAASSRKLSDKAQTAELFASPFAFWEIASHLGGEEFTLIKANLMKFHHVTLLQEPTTSAEEDLALVHADLQDRLNTPDVIYAMLAALRASTSVAELCRCQIQDAEGIVREIDGSVTRIQEMLVVGERQFKEFMTSVTKLLLAKEIILDTSDAFHASILDLTNGWWLQVRSRSDQSDDSYRKLIRRGYFFYAYVLYRAADYTHRRTTNIDGNDFEDAKLLLHLTIDDDVTVVTSDKALENCLLKTIRTLNGLNDDWYKTRVQVCDTQSFLSML